MRNVFALLTAAVMSVSVLAQTPQKMSYQAVIRNSSNGLVTNTQIGMEINIRLGSPDGAIVYTETLTPTTNNNGLVSIEIGGNSGFGSINWSMGVYFLETKTDPTGGANYSIIGTSQLLSVPFALHANTAEIITGMIPEIDPVFMMWDRSSGISITEGQISDLGNYLETEMDPEFMAWDKSSGISITESQIADLGNYLETEMDPAVEANFDFTDAAEGDLLQFNGNKWTKVTPNYLTSFTEMDPEFMAWDKSSGISITESQISDLGNYLETEMDPTVEANFDFTDAAEGDLLQFNGNKWTKVTPNYLTSFTEMDPQFMAWDKSSGISITESQISDLGSYLETEMDPAVEANFDFTDAAEGDLLQFNGNKWTKVTPNYLTSFTEMDPEFMAWDKSSGISITESQIADLGNYLETEMDPSVVANFDFTDAAEGDLLQFNGTKWTKVTPNYLSSFTEIDPEFMAWDKSSGISITESQIADLGNYLEMEMDPAVEANFDFADAAEGDLLQFNGTKWTKVTPNYLTNYTETDPLWTASPSAAITAENITDWNSKLDTESQNIQDVLEVNNNAGNNSIVNVNQLTIGSATSTPSAALEVNSTSGAFLLPRMTTAQRDALSPVVGMMVYNTEENKFQGYSSNGSCNEDVLHNNDADINSSTSVGTDGIGVPNYVGQSFVPQTCGGVLQSFVVKVYGTSTTPVQCNVYLGEGYGGTLLGSVSTTFNASGNFTIDLSSLNIALEVGTTYSVRLYSPESFGSSTSVAHMVNFMGENNATYPHGNYLDYQGTPQTNSDMWFEIHVAGNSFTWVDLH